MLGGSALPRPHPLGLVALSLVTTWTVTTSSSSGPKMAATRYPFTMQ